MSTPGRPKTGGRIVKGLTASRSTPSFAIETAPAPYFSTPPRADVAAASSSPATAARSPSRPRTAASPTDPWADPRYRNALAGNVQHREDELMWQWHLWRLRNVKGQVDVKPPHMGAHKKKTVQTSHTDFRAAEIQASNAALVSRIRTQRSAYADLFAPSVTAAADRERAKRRDAAAAIAQGGAAMASTSRVGAVASRLEQRRIEQNNQLLLRHLKKINTSEGPYNSQRVQRETAEIERRTQRRRIPSMHAHPVHSLKSEDGTYWPPPIHWGAIAARATSPYRNQRQPPERRAAPPLIPEPLITDWRAYAHAKGLTTSPSTPALTQQQQQQLYQHEHEHAQQSPHQEQPHTRTGRMSRSSSTARVLSPQKRPATSVAGARPSPGTGASTGRPATSHGNSVQRSPSTGRVGPSTSRPATSSAATARSPVRRQTAPAGTATARGRAVSMPRTSKLATFSGLSTATSAAAAAASHFDEKHNDETSPYAPAQSHHTHRSHSSAKSTPQSAPKRLSAAEQRLQDAALMDSLLDTVNDMELRGELDPPHTDALLEAAAAAAAAAQEQNTFIAPSPSKSPPSRPAAAEVVLLSPLRPSTLSSKRALGRSNVPLLIDGHEVVIVGEVHDASLNTLQFTCYVIDQDEDDDDEHSEQQHRHRRHRSRSNQYGLPPLLVSFATLERIFPSSIAGLLSPPYSDLTSLLYALAPRFYFKEQEGRRQQRRGNHNDDEEAEDDRDSGDSYDLVFAMHTETNFLPPDTLQYGRGVLMHSRQEEEELKRYQVPPAEASTNHNSHSTQQQQEPTAQAPPSDDQPEYDADEFDAHPHDADAEAAPASSAAVAPTTTWLADELLNSGQHGYGIEEGEEEDEIEEDV